MTKPSERRRNFKPGDSAFHIIQKKMLFDVCKVEIEKVLEDEYLVKIPGVDIGFTATESELFSGLRGAAKAKEFFS